jgi:HicB_like antitoxin of bacterial toxin-antitoxin system
MVNGSDTTGRQPELTLMSKKRIHPASLREYVTEVLKNAVYDRGEQLDVVVAEAPDLPGCLTQGDSFEEARDNLVDAIEVWLMSGLRNGEDLPVVNGRCLGITAVPRGPRHGRSQRRLEA